MITLYEPLVSVATIERSVVKSKYPGAMLYLHKGNATYYDSVLKEHLFSVDLEDSLGDEVEAHPDLERLRTDLIALGKSVAYFRLHT